MSHDEAVVENKLALMRGVDDDEEDANVRKDLPSPADVLCEHPVTDNNDNSMLDVSLEAPQSLDDDDDDAASTQGAVNMVVEEDQEGMVVDAEVHRVILEEASSPLATNNENAEQGQDDEVEVSVPVMKAVALDEEAAHEEEREQRELEYWENVAANKEATATITRPEPPEEAAGHKWWTQQKSRAIVIFGIVFLCIVVAVAIILGVMLPSNDESDEDTTDCFQSREDLLQSVDALVDGNDSFEQGLEISNWCVSDVSDFSHLFSAERNSNMASFALDISNWDLSSATNTSCMFLGATNFNQNISAWDVSNVQDMSSMFRQAASFNQGLQSWNVANVRDLNAMFAGASSFSQPISSWNLSSALNLAFMFANASSFNEHLCAWGETIPSNANVTGMFRDSSCSVVLDPDLSTSTPGPFCTECILINCTGGPFCPGTLPPLN